MADKKIFTIEINGVEKAYKEIVSLKDAMEMLDGVQANVGTSSANVNNSQKELSSSIAGMRDRIADLTKEYESLSDAQRASSMGTDKLNSIKSLQTELDKATQAIRQQTEATKASGTANAAETTSIEGKKAALKKLEIAYGKLSAAQRKSSDGIKKALEIQSLTAEIAKLEKQSQSSLLVFGQLGASFQSVGDRANELKDIFTDTQSLVSALGIDNEGLNQTFANMNEIMSVVNTVQALSTQLTKQDGIATKALTVIKKAYTQAVQGGSRALGIFKGALAATGVGALSILLGYLIANFDDLKKMLAGAFGGMENMNKIIDESQKVVFGLGNVLLQYLLVPINNVISAVKGLTDVFFILKDKGLSGLGEAWERTKQIGGEVVDNFKDGLNVVDNYNKGVEVAAERQDEMAAAMRKGQEAASGSIVKIKGLQAQWNLLGNDLEAKKKFINDNQEAFKDLGVEVGSVEDAEKLLVKNSKQVIQSMVFKAQATALQELASQKYKEALQAEMDGDAEASKQRLNEADKLIAKMVEMQQQAQKMRAESGVKEPDDKKSGGNKGGNKKSDAADKKKQEQEKLKEQTEQYNKETEQMAEDHKDQLNKTAVEASKGIISNLLKEKTEIKGIEDIAQKLLVDRQKSATSDLAIALLQELLALKKKNEDKYTEEEKAYEKLLELAQGNTAAMEQIQKDWDIRSVILRQEANDSEREMETEHLTSMNELEQQFKEQRYSNLENSLDEENKLVSEKNKELKELLENTTVKRKNGLVDIGATKEKLKEGGEAIKENLKVLEESHDRKVALFDAEYKMAEGDAKKQKQVLTEKALSLKEYDKAHKELIEQQSENTKESANVLSEFFKSLSGKMQGYISEYQQLSEGIFGIFNAAISMQLDDIKDKLDKTTKKYDEVVDKRKEVQDRLKSLEDEAQNASGGRALVLQEQIARQMEANEDLAKQEGGLAKDKEKLEKEKAKKEKQQKKMELRQKFIMSIANTAMAVSNGLATPPLLPIGLAMAVMAGIKGAIETASIAKQISKLEDGGLLRGNRHAQGGMRIEGTNVEVEGDEYVVNRASTRKNLGLIEYINRERRELSPHDINAYFSRSGQIIAPAGGMKRMFEEGGMLTNLEVADSAAPDPNGKVLEAISKINFQPVVSVVDIMDAQTNLTEIRDIVGA